MRLAVHTHYGEELVYSMTVGATDWGGPAELARRISAAWHPLCEWTRSWLEVIGGHGFEAVQRAYLDGLDGRVDANTAHLLTLD